MIRNFIYFMPILISIMGIFSIRTAKNNKDRKSNLFLIFFNIINILYLFVISALMPNLLPIITSLSLLLTQFISIIGGILYFISLITCIKKIKELNDNSDNKNNIKILIITILIPIFIFIFALCKEMYLINNSEFILSFYSAGNGTVGDTQDFVYVISDKYYKEISVDVGLSYNYYNKMFLPKELKKVTEDELYNKGIKISIDNDNTISVYRDKKLVYKIIINNKYFNNKLEDIFYNK